MNSSQDNGCWLIAGVLLVIAGALAGVVVLACAGVFYLQVRRDATYREIDNELKAFHQRSNAAISSDLAKHGLISNGAAEETIADQDEITFAGKALDTNQVEHSYKVTYRTRGIGANQTFERLRLQLDDEPVQ